MEKTQEEVEKAKMGEDDTCPGEACNIEAAANAAMDEGARKVKEENAYHSFAASERNAEARKAAEKEEREARAQELKERMESEKGERLKARVKGNLKSGIKAVGASIVGGAREMAVNAVTPQKTESGKYGGSGYLPATRGGFNFPQMGQPVAFSPKMSNKGKKGKKNNRVSAQVVTGKRNFSTGIGMHPRGTIGTGMSFVPPAVPHFGSPATPRGNFSKQFQPTNIRFEQMNVKPPAFGEAHFGKSVASKRDFASGMKLNINFGSSPFGAKKTNPLKGKKHGLWG